MKSIDNKQMQSVRTARVRLNCKTWKLRNEHKSCAETAMFMCSKKNKIFLKQRKVLIKSAATAKKKHKV